MTKRQFEKQFAALTRCIFTAVTAEAAILLTTLSKPIESFAEAGFYRSIPECLEYLNAGILLYLLCAAAASAAWNQSRT
ncbi:MAG: hypothetical protein IKY52_13265 [Clostridia bacterium]|nr:hypothetical protein [Clostridia bacterium]